MVHRLETKILRLTFRPKMQPGEVWVTYKARTSRMLRMRWKKKGRCPHRQNCALKNLGRRWSMKWDPLNFICWKHKWGFYSRGVTWDTPMARWAGSGEDWMQKLRTGPPKKAEVIPTLVLAIHCICPPLHIKKADGRHSSQERKRTGSLVDGASENR